MLRKVPLAGPGALRSEPEAVRRSSSSRKWCRHEVLPAARPADRVRAGCQDRGPAVTEFRIPFLGNRLLAGATLLAFSLHLAVTTWPVSAAVMGLNALSVPEWLLCTGLGATVLVLVELEKLLRRRASAARARRSG